MARERFDQLALQRIAELRCLRRRPPGMFGRLGFVAGQRLQSLDSGQTRGAGIPTVGPLGVRARPRRSPIEQIKARIGDPYRFIAGYVQLEHSGRGHCPFHPPDIHPSFAVNKIAGYWTDFHEVNPKTAGTRAATSSNSIAD
jgi:hypothetical protein